MNRPSALIAGCGDVGIALGQLLHKHGYQVTGLRRNISALPGWIRALPADLTRRKSLRGDFSFDTVIYLPTPGERTRDAYENAFISGLANLWERLDKQQLKQLFFVSSTAVYHHDAGEEVDECTTTHPRQMNGEVLLAAEKQALDLAGEVCHVVRFGGIYGPGRDFLIRAAKNAEKLPTAQYTNRIHRDDAAGAIAHLVTSDAKEVHYCAVDSAPCLNHEIYQWIREQFGLAKLADQETTPTTGKRVSNRRLLNSGFHFKYPSYREGYSQVLALQGKG